MSQCNWLCRMIGHRWVTHIRGRKDGKRVMWQTIWPACVRCGEPAPDVLLSGADDLVDAMANEAAHAARGWENVEAYRKRMMWVCAETLDIKPENGMDWLEQQHEQNKETNNGKA